MRRRVLVLTRDMIPLGGRPVSGGGLRAWGLGEALRSRGHDVVYSVPTSLVPDGEEHAELRRLSFDPEELHRTLLRAEPDLVLVEQWGLATYLQDVSIPVVVDLHGSLILENAYRKHRTLTSNAAAKIKALHKADLVICPAVRQRAYFMSWLMMSGADPKELPVEVVPVSMSPELPPRPERGDDTPLSLVYGGQLWPWIDSGSALSAAAAVLEELGAGKCHLFVEKPQRVDVVPYDNATKVRSGALDDGLRNLPTIEVEGLLPHTELLERYAEADLAIDVYAWNSERELAYTTRTVEYLWCGVPVLYADYGELAPLIREYDAGWIVPADDDEVIRETLREALSDRGELRRRSENAQRLVKECLTWDQTVGPLDRFAREPVVREKGQTIFGRLALEFDRIAGEGRARVGELEQQLAEQAAVNAKCTAELVGQDRRYTELVDRHGRHTAAWDRERRGMERSIAELKAEVQRAVGDASGGQELLRCEQDDHAVTSARLEAVRAENRGLQHQLGQQRTELSELRAELKRAVERINDEAANHGERVESLERQLREVSQQELDLRTDLAGEAAQAESFRGRLATRDKEIERLKEQIDTLSRALSRMKDHWLQRTVATGQHSLRRVASQVPTLAGLFVRNLAQNAHLAIWQKRHGVRIFPGQ